MNITVNLATRPYIELRPVYARLRVVAVALAVLALPMLLVLRVEQTKAGLARARVAQLESNIALLRRQAATAQTLAREGPNANVLTEAAFLNDLFHRKAFSWTATMSDLETTLPTGVQVSFIDPVVAPDGHVTIRMRVTGARDRTVDVVRNLEHSRHFMAPRLVAEALANQSNGGQARSVGVVTNLTDVNFDIVADYRPLPNSHDKAGIRAVPPRNAASRMGTAELTNPDPSTAAPVRHTAGRRPAPKPFAGVAAPAALPGGTR